MGNAHTNHMATKSPETLLEGYAEFAEFVASDPQLAIYRRYETLASRNLHYLEAEVQLLDLQLRDIDREDADILKNGTDEIKTEVDTEARDWEKLHLLAGNGSARAQRKLQKIQSLNQSMKDYEKALIRRSIIANLSRPEKGNFKAFKNWFRTRVPLRGSGWHLLDNEDDWVSLKSTEDEDRLTILIQRYFSYQIRQKRNVPDSWGKANLFYYPPERVAWIVAILSVLISASLLIGAIVILHFVTSMGKRLGIIGAFTAAFAASIGLLTNARRPEIFGSTAAYVAVLVVFVSVN